MVKSVENGVSTTPFLAKCYEMVSDDATNELISWAESNDSFIISDEAKFASELLPKYFKHNNISSFIRQLNIYGFRKIDSDRLEFANESFIKGQKHLLKNITRRKHPQGQSQRKPVPENDVDTLLSSEAEKKLALKKEVETLKTDKIALTQELAKLTKHQEISQKKMLLIGEQIKGMEKNQQQMLSFIVMAMQRPEFFMQFLQPKDNTWSLSASGKNKFSDVTDDYESLPSDGAIVRYQPPEYDEPMVQPPEYDEPMVQPPEYDEPMVQPPDEQVLASNSGASNLDDPMAFNLSPDELNDILLDFDMMFGSSEGNAMPSSENHGQFVLPDASENDDILLEQLLSSSPRKNYQFGELEREASTDARMQIGRELQPKEFTKQSNIDKDDEDVYQVRDGSSHQKSEHN